MDHAEAGYVGPFDQAVSEIIFHEGMPALTQNGILGDARPATAAHGRVYFDTMADFLAQWVETQRAVSRRWERNRASWRRIISTISSPMRSGTIPCRPASVSNRAIRWSLRRSKRPRSRSCRGAPSEARRDAQFRSDPSPHRPGLRRGRGTGRRADRRGRRLAHKGWGWNAVIPGFGLLADDFSTPYLHHYALGDDCLFREDIRIPYEPFCGVMGLAPREHGRFTTIPPRENGGNLDIRHLTPGSSRAVPGADARRALLLRRLPLRAG